MSAAVLRTTVLQARRSMVILSLAAGLFYFLVLLSSSAFLTDRPEAAPFFDDPPRFMQAFLGGEVDFLRPAGWLAVTMTHPITYALLTAGALMISSGAVAAEVERGSIDLVLTRPVGRAPFLMAKAAAAALAVTLIEIGGFVGFLVARLGVGRIAEIPVGSAAMAFGGSWLLFLATAMVALLVSARSSLRGRATGVAIGLVVGTYFANFIALLIDGAEDLRFLSPFNYFRAGDLISGEATLGSFGVLVALALAALAAAVAVFARRDLTR